MSLTFATAAEESMDAFMSVSAESAYQRQLEAYAESLLQQRCTRPEWCVLALNGRVPVARAALWSLPAAEIPTDLVLIDADWSDTDVSTGQAVITRTHDLARNVGADDLSHSIDSPPEAPQYQDNEQARVRLLESCGYELRRDGVRWRYSGTESTTAAPSLLFRSLPDVGEDAFVAAIEATYEGTRDSWISSSIEELGLLGAARADFLDMQGMERQQDWWELAYTADGLLAGVIMAARNPTSAVIAYVGVVPEQRGRGLAAELVRRGTARLVDSAAAEIRGDCDRDNVPMVKAFERAGYQDFARRRTFHRLLRGVPPVL